MDVVSHMFLNLRDLELLRDYIKLKNTTSIFFFGHALQHADRGVPHEVEALNLNHWTTRKDPNHSQNKICKLQASCKHSFKVPYSPYLQLCNHFDLQSILT